MHDHVASLANAPSSRYKFHFRPQSYSARYRKRILNQLNTRLQGKEVMELYWEAQAIHISFLRYERSSI